MWGASKKGTAMNNQKGFTLIELIMAMVIMVIIATITATVGFQAVYEYLIVKDRIGLIEDGRIALRRIIRDIRLIDEREIYIADAQQISFRNVYGQTVQIQLSGTVLLRNGQVIANNVTLLSFDYFDRDNNFLIPFPLSSTNIENINWILTEIHITLRDQTVKLRSQVFPRDFR
jgi:prepilin-type N-terminal cleavage/methylation domain-containing protein